MYEQRHLKAQASHTVRPPRRLGGPLAPATAQDLSLRATKPVGRSWTAELRRRVPSSFVRCLLTSRDSFYSALPGEKRVILPGGFSPCPWRFFVPFRCVFWRRLFFPLRRVTSLFLPHKVGYFGVCYDKTRAQLPLLGPTPATNLMIATTVVRR